MLRRHHHTILWSIAVALFLVLGLGLWGAYQLWRVPKVIAAEPALAATNVPLQSTISIQFDRPIDQNALQPEISPTVAGEWQYEDDVLNTHLYKRAVFVPDKHLEPAQDYKVVLRNVEPVLGNNQSSYEYNFRTEPVPGLSGVSLKEGDSVSICQTFSFSLESDPAQLAEFSATLLPDTQVSLTPSSDKKTYTIAPKSCLQQDASYTLSISRSVTVYNKAGQLQFKEPPTELAHVGFHTHAAPVLSSFSPTDNAVLTTSQTISLGFSKPMDHSSVEQNVRFSPALTGSWKWENDQSAQFTSTAPLQYDTIYSVTVPQGTRDQEQGYSGEDVTRSFKTIGHAVVNSFLPRNGSSEVSVSAAISIQFDQEVEHASAESAFSISPSVAGSFSWQGNRMTFSPAELNKDGSYTASEAKGVKSVHGLETAVSYSTSFTTEESVTMLNIAQDYQDHPLSCEIAALKMALNYRGAHVEEADIIAIVGFDPTPHTDNIWGDPDVAFVGDINGRQNTTGYGVHWGPIAAAARHYRPATAFSGMSAVQLAQNIQEGNPVVAWGVEGRGSVSTWQTPGGKTVTAWVGEHARTVIGFKGPADNPHSFIINDPIAGRVTWTTSQLLSNWSTYNNSGVVVY